MPITPLTYRCLFVEPVLEYLDQGIDGSLNSPERISIIVNIANHESGGFRHVEQIGRGPALGFTQIEEDTHDDVWMNWLAFRKQLAIKAWGLTGYKPFTEIPPTGELIYNHGYGVAMTAFILRRAPGALPGHLDFKAQAQYWKLRYNTPKGKGVEKDFVTRAEEAYRNGLY